MGQARRVHRRGQEGRQGLRSQAPQGVRRRARQQGAQG
ncbi:hypothetical protein CSIM01_11009 [Colletotrichum simmondsii]|uniref:Uncharacterized protein n=1 Tax=Colletotrichum simmondsii TaxID=703756 RepID=A0A135TIN0_9PEZI|nr:hypothetical protein CSIM01_11009 [Colletotrichum simmondsii]